VLCAEAQNPDLSVKAIALVVSWKIKMNGMNIKETKLQCTTIAFK